MKFNSASALFAAAALTLAPMPGLTQNAPAAAAAQNAPAAGGANAPAPARGYNGAGQFDHNGNNGNDMPGNAPRNGHRPRPTLPPSHWCGYNPANNGRCGPSYNNQPVVIIDGGSFVQTRTTPKPGPTHRPAPAKNNGPKQDVFSTMSTADAWK